MLSSYFKCALELDNPIGFSTFHILKHVDESMVEHYSS